MDTQETSPAPAPEPEKDQGGRPPHVPTKASRSRVAIAAGAGMTHEEIATGLGITPPTLRKHYALELSQVAQAKRLEVFEAMHRAAKKGNVAAQKAYIAAGDPRTPEPLPPDPTQPEEKPLGKKDQANVDAKTAAEGTDWGPLLRGPTALQ